MNRQPIIHDASEPALAKRRVNHEFGTSLMSDTKWRKAIAALDRPDTKLDQAIVKLIGDDSELRITMPKAYTLYPPKPYIDCALGVIMLRNIEWIELPRFAEWSRSAPDRKGRISPRVEPQDVEKAKAALDSVGQFVIDETSRGFRIIGYRR